MIITKRKTKDNTMTTAATQAKMHEILNAAKAGHEIIPAFFQPIYGYSAAVSAAVRMLLKSGAIVECGKDGCGKPKYRAAMKAATHATTNVLQ